MFFLAANSKKNLLEFDQQRFLSEESEAPHTRRTRQAELPDG